MNTILVYYAAKPLTLHYIRNAYKWCAVMGWYVESRRSGTLAMDLESCAYTKRQPKGNRAGDMTFNITSIRQARLLETHDVHTVFVISLFLNGQYLFLFSLSWVPHKLFFLIGVFVGWRIPNLITGLISRWWAPLFLASTVSALRRNAHIWNASHPLLVTYYRWVTVY